jgi:acetoacetate decarboxylase
MDALRVMPLIMGPVPPGKAGSHYRERQMLTLQYRTESAAIERLLPACFKPSVEAVVTVAFTDNNGVDFGVCPKVASLCALPE